jgi:serine phosphatase RsbU (regulator of sigma subunit)
VGEVTGAVNNAMRNDRNDGTFCTLAYATLDLTTVSVTLELALAGHPQPVLRRADGTVEAIGVHGTVLGVTDSPRRTVTRHELHPRDIVLLYADGATERRTGVGSLGEAGLHRLIAAAPAAAAATELVEFVQQRIVDYSDEPLRDDMAMLAIRITPR